MKFKNILILITISFIFIAAKKDSGKIFTLKNFEKNFAKVDTNLYASKYEVSNLLYITFLKELKSKNMTSELIISQIDSLAWNNIHYNNAAFVELYHTHPAYFEYPVVNITYEGANLFCKWLTKKYNSYPKRKFKEVNFRLPTEKEWEKAAYGTFSLIKYPWGGNYLRNFKGCAMANFKMIGEENLHYDTITKNVVVAYKSCSKPLNLNNKREEVAKKVTEEVAEPILFTNIGIYNSFDITAPVSSFSRNSIGIYNMCGNVAEMVSKKGIARGGGWNSTGYDIQITSASTYNKPASNIGFRYFVEIIEN